MKSNRTIAHGLLFFIVLGCVPFVRAQKAEQPASLSQLEASLKRDPDNPKLLIALGLACWDRNDYPHALEAFQRAVKVAPSSAEAHNWLGVAIMEKANLPGAIAEFKKAVVLDPKLARAQTNLGSALAKSGEIGEAVEVFRKALALEPANPAAQMNLGVALREKGDATAALVYMRQVAEQEPTNASVQYELGQTLRQSGDLPSSIVAFESALQIALSLVASLITAAYSRRREFRADAAAAALAGRSNMVAALKRLQTTTDRVDMSQAALATLKVAGGKSWIRAFATHPPLDARIAALEEMGY